MLRVCAEHTKRKTGISTMNVCLIAKKRTEETSARGEYITRGKHKGRKIGQYYPTKNIIFVRKDQWN